MVFFNNIGQLRTFVAEFQFAQKLTVMTLLNDRFFWAA